MSTVIIPVIISQAPPAPPSTHYYAFQSSDGILITTQVNTTDAARAESLAGEIAESGLTRVAYPVYDGNRSFKKSFFGNGGVVEGVGVSLLYGVMTAFMVGMLVFVGALMFPAFAEAFGITLKNGSYYYVDHSPIYAIRAAVCAFVVVTVSLLIVRFGTEDAR